MIISKKWAVILFLATVAALCCGVPWLLAHNL